MIVNYTLFFFAESCKREPDSSQAARNILSFLLLYVRSCTYCSPVIQFIPHSGLTGLSSASGRGWARLRADERRPHTRRSHASTMSAADRLCKQNVHATGVPTSRAAKAVVDTLKLLSLVIYMNLSGRIIASFRKWERGARFQRKVQKQRLLHKKAA